MSFPFYATQVNRKQINKVMDTLQKANQDMNILLNITDAVTQHLRYHQIYAYACTIFAYLRDCLTYLEQVATHTMGYMDATITNMLSTDILPVQELKGMLRHIESQLPLIMHLPISLDNTLHFCRSQNPYASSRKQFILLIDVPLQDRAQHLQIYKIFNLPVLHGDMSVGYKINDKYIGITYDETQALVITEQQYSTYVHTKGKFC